MDTLRALKEMEIPSIDTSAFVLLRISPSAQKGKKKLKSKTNKNLPFFLWWLPSCSLVKLSQEAWPQTAVRIGILKKNLDFIYHTGRGNRASSSFIWGHDILCVNNDSSLHSNSIRGYHHLQGLQTPLRNRERNMYSLKSIQVIVLISPSRPSQTPGLISLKSHHPCCVIEAWRNNWGVEEMEVERQAGFIL